MGNPRFDLQPKFLFEILLLAVLVYKSMGKFPYVPKRTVMIFTIVAAFLIGSYIQGHNFVDVAIELKIIFYLALMPYLFKLKISPKLFSNFILILLCIYFVYYGSLSSVGVRRPEFIFENNFEVTGLCIALVAFNHIQNYNKASTFFPLILLTGVIIFSGSRTGYLCLIITYLDYFFRNNFTFKNICIALVCVGLLSVFLFISNARLSAPLESIDRFKFLMVLFNEMEIRGIYKSAFGSFPILPLSSESCEALRGYPTKFSKSGDGTCYAVILHSSIMRNLINFGILGSLAIYVFIFYQIRAVPGLGFSKANIFLAMIFVSGLGISSINNNFILLFLVISLSALTSHNLSKLRPRGDNSNLLPLRKKLAKNSFN